MLNARFGSLSREVPKVDNRLINENLITITFQLLARIRLKSKKSSYFFGSCFGRNDDSGSGSIELPSAAHLGLGIPLPIPDDCKKDS